MTYPAYYYKEYPCDHKGIHMFSSQCLHFRSAPPYLECTGCLSAIALRHSPSFSAQWSGRKRLCMSIFWVITFFRKEPLETASRRCKTIIAWFISRPSLFFMERMLWAMECDWSSARTLQTPSNQCYSGSLVHSHFLGLCIELSTLYTKPRGFVMNSSFRLLVKNAQYKGPLSHRGPRGLQWSN